MVWKKTDVSKDVVEEFSCFNYVYKLQNMCASHSWPQKSVQRNSKLWSFWKVIRFGQRSSGFGIKPSGMKKHFVGVTKAQNSHGSLESSREKVRSFIVVFGKVSSFVRRMGFKIHISGLFTNRRWLDKPMSAPFLPPEMEMGSASLSGTDAGATCGQKATIIYFGFINVIIRLSGLRMVTAVLPTLFYRIIIEFFK